MSMKNYLGDWYRSAGSFTGEHTAREKMGRGCVL